MNYVFDHETDEDSRTSWDDECPIHRIEWLMRPDTSMSSDLTLHWATVYNFIE